MGKHTGGIFTGSMITAALAWLLPAGALHSVPALAQASAQASTHKPTPTILPTAVKAADVLVRFPDRTMGKIFTVNPNWNPEDLPPDGTFYSVARGPVLLRGNLTYRFTPNMSICEHPEYLAKFPAGTLCFLNLAQLEVNDALLDVVGKLQWVRELTIDETDISDEQLQKIGKMPNVQHLNLSKNTLRGPGLLRIAGPELKRLDLSYVIVDRNVGQNLEHLPKLSTLFLCHSCIKDSDLPSLARIKTLEHLKLSSNNDITDSGMKALLPLKKLRTLEVENTRVTTAGLLTLKGLPIKVIYLDQRCEDRDSQLRLGKAYPGVNLKFQRKKDDIPVEVFAPLH